MSCVIGRQGMNSGGDPETGSSEDGGKEISRLGSPTVNYHSAQECSDGVDGHHERIAGGDVGVRQVNLLAHGKFKNRKSGGKPEETEGGEPRGHHNHDG